MDSLLAVRSCWAGRLLFLARVSVLALPLAAAGCTDKACLRWDSKDREASGAATSGATTGGAGGGGGAGGASGMGGAAGAAAPVEPAEIVCPSPALAKQLLGNPSCTEVIEVLDDEGEYDPETDQCCYDVRTKTQPCAVKE
jgi:hypothetical protein